MIPYRKHHAASYPIREFIAVALSLLGNGCLILILVLCIIYALGLIQLPIN